MIYILPILAVFIGYIVAHVTERDTLWIKLFLVFSGSFLLSIILTDLFPQIYSYPNTKLVGTGVVLGLLIQVLLEFLSKGAEHGHFHHTKDIRTVTLLFISLSIHALLEGASTTHSYQTLWGVVIHKLPISILLSTLIINLKIKKHYKLLLISLFAMMTPLGSFVNLYLEYRYENLTMFLLSLSTGIILHVSSVIIFESSEHHKFNIAKFIAIITGMGLAMII